MDQRVQEETFKLKGTKEKKLYLSLEVASASEKLEPQQKQHVPRWCLHEMKKEKARLEQESATVEANLEALKLEKESAATLAEVEALDPSETSALSSHVISVRKEEYIKNQTRVRHQTLCQPVQRISSAYVADIVQKWRRICDRECLQSTRYPDSPYHLPLSILNTASKASTCQYPASQRYSVHSDMQHFFQSQTIPMLDFGQDLANLMIIQKTLEPGKQDLQLSTSKELDLLVKWLGKESSDNVRRIKDVYVTSPQGALQLSC